MSITVGTVSAMQFMNRTDITQVSITGDIGPFAFYGCTNLQTVSLATGSTKIGEYAFYGCKKLTNVSMTRLTRFFGDCAFGDCSGEVNFLYIPIDYASGTLGGAPSGTPSLYIPPRVVSHSAFAGSSTLKLKMFTDSDSVLYPPIVSYGGYLTESNTWMGGYLNTGVIGPDNTVSSAGWFLSNNWTTKTCNGINSSRQYPPTSTPLPSIIVIPYGIETIAPRAFEGNTSISAVIFPETLKNIGEFAFYGCTQLSTILFWNGTVDISAYAFAGCTSLRTTVLRQVSRIGDGAFADCGFQSAKLNTPSAIIARSAFSGNLTTTKLILPNQTEVSVADIQSGAYAGVGQVPSSGNFLVIDGSTKTCTGFRTDSYPRPKTLAIPEGVEVVAESAFASDSSITSVFTPSTLKTVSANAFIDCSEVTFIGLTEGVVTVSQNAFKNTRPSTLVIPASTRSIGSGAFAECSTLTNVSYGPWASFKQLAFSAGVYTGTPYIQTLATQTHIPSLVSFAPFWDVATVVWKPISYSFCPPLSYKVSVDGEVVSTLRAPNMLDASTVLPGFTTHSVSIQAMLDETIEWGSPTTISFDNSGLSETIEHPSWWSNYLSNAAALESVLASRYVPRLLTPTEAQPLTYHLSRSGTISGSLMEYAIDWYVRAIQFSDDQDIVNEANVMLTYIYRRMFETTDNSALSVRGERAIISFIPQIIQIQPTVPSFVHLAGPSKIYMAWQQPTYFWNCFKTYRIYVDSSLVEADASGSHILLGDVALGSRTVELSAVNLLGLEGAKRSQVIAVGGTETWTADVLDVPVRTVTVGGNTAAKLDSVFPVNSAQGRNARVRMLGGLGVEIGTNTPYDVTVLATADRTLSVSWSYSGTSILPATRFSISVRVGSDVEVLVVDTSSALTTFPVTGLSAWTEYHFLVKAVYEDGTSSAWSTPSLPIHALSVPPAPQDLDLLPENNLALKMVWTPQSVPAAGVASSFTVELVDVVDPSGSVVINDISGTSFTATNKASVYKFRVKGHNQFGGGEWSAYSRVVDRAVLPGAPSLSAEILSPGGQDISYTWDPPENNGPAITSYDLIINGDVIQVDLSSPRSDVLSGQEYGIPVVISVRAVNSNGAGLPSDVTLIPTTIPNAPTAVSVNQVDTTATVTWTAPAFVGGTPIRRYKYYLTSDNVTTSAETASADTTIDISGLTIGATYTVQVSAINDVGEGEKSSVTSPFTIVVATVPGAPGTVYLDADSGNLTWSVPQNGGASVTQYRIKLYVDSSLNSTSVIDISGGSTTTFTFTGVPTASIYGAAIAARNRVGWGMFAIASPAVLKNLTANPSGNQAVTVSWVPPSMTGSPNVIGYRVTAEYLGSSSVNPITIDGSGSSVTFTDLRAMNLWKDTLDSGVPEEQILSDAASRNCAYRFSVEAQFNEDVSGSKFSATINRAPVTAPGAVENVTLTEISGGNLRLSWESPKQTFGPTGVDGKRLFVNDGGSPIVSYTVDLSDGTVANSVRTVTNAATTELIWKPVSHGNFTARIFAANAVVAGPSVASSSRSYTTLPAKPLNLRGVALSRTSASIAWTAPSNTGGLPVTSYDVEYYVDPRPSIDVSASTISNETSLTLTGLNEANTYKIRVRTVTSKGTSAWSDYITFKIDVAESPVINSVVALKDVDNIVVNWTRVLGASYKIMVSIDNKGVETFTDLTTDPITEPTFTFPASMLPLPPGSYKFRVKAMTDPVSGFGAWTLSNSVLLGTTGEEVVCFLGDAPVLTPSGYQRIDSLRIGDMVRTADGRDVPIRRVRHQRVVASRQSNPYRIERGQFGATETVLISPDHRIMVAGRGLVEARHLGLTQVKQGDTLDYFNLELPCWESDNMVVAGVEVESMARFARVRMSLAKFSRLLRERYGENVAPSVLEHIRAQCVFFSDGSVVVPTTQARKGR
jgi:hypothetical protein